MGEVLGNVLEPVSAKRGPDVALKLTAPPAWLRRGQQLVVELPRRLSCARCEGGGCDACQRRGAFTLREAGAAQETVVLTLSQDVEGSAIQIRVPDRGAPGPTDEPPGQLIVTLSAGDVPSGGLSRRDEPVASGKLPLPWLALPVLLVLMYVLVTALTRN